MSDLKRHNTESLKKAIDLLKDAMSELAEASCHDDYQLECGVVSDVVVPEIFKLEELLKNNR